jgi:hypothetical protein
MHAVEERAIGHHGTGGMLIEIFVVPARRNPGGKEGLDLGSQIKCVLVNAVVERLDAESIARGE